GAGIATNDIGAAGTASASCGTVKSTGGSVTVDASTDQDIDIITVGGAGAGTFALGGSVSINEIANTVAAKITGTADVDAATALFVTASDDSTITADAGGVAIAISAASGGTAGSAAIGLAFAF